MSTHSIWIKALLVAAGSLLVAQENSAPAAEAATRKLPAVSIGVVDLAKALEAYPKAIKMQQEYNELKESLLRELGKIDAASKEALENIKAVLTHAGSSMERVFKCTVYLVNIADFAKMNEVYATYFPKDPPARSTVAGSGLALGAKVEIECLATVG